MTYALRNEGGLDYQICHYGTHRGQFRGPERDLRRPHVAVLGGTEAFGRFVADPYPDRLERSLGRPVVNLGAINASVDLYLNESKLLAIAEAADVTVIQLCGVQNLSNRFYKVHPRRNDRFVRATALLKTVYRELELTEIHFTRHLLAAMNARSTTRFASVVEELQRVWLTRMRLLIERIGGPVVLLWLSSRPPEALPLLEPMTSPDPMFVTRGMLDRLSPLVHQTVEVISEHHPTGSPGENGLIFTDVEEDIASRMLPAQTHSRVEAELERVIRGMNLGGVRH